MLELARESDWTAVKRLSIQIHDLHAAWRPDLYVHCNEPYPYQRFLADIQQRLVYVAKLQNVIVGYVVLAVLQKDGPGTVPQKLLRLESICVDQMAQRQGIGQEMIMDVRALARAFGCREVLLGVHPENDSAIAFYRKCGFSVRTVNMEIKV